MTASEQRLYVEFDATEPCPIVFDDEPTIVLYFASWAFSLRFGAQHELAQAAQRIQQHHRIELRPLLHYANRTVEDEADRHELEQMWQESGPLADCCHAVTNAITSGDEPLAALLEDYETLAPRLRELAAMCDWAEAKGARVRLSFDLGPVATAHCT